MPTLIRRLALSALLLLASGGVVADWVQVEDSPEDGGYKTYLDPKTVLKSVGLVRVWTFTDYAQVQVAGGVLQFMSIRAQHEYDCRQQVWRTLQLTAHSRNRLQGRVVHQESEPGSWAPVVPDTAGDVRFKLLCRYL